MCGQGLDAREIKENGWRQGSILSKHLVDTLVDKKVLVSPCNGVWIVISHDCDVTNESLTLEPNVELLFARSLEPNEIDGNRMWGKNSRVIQFKSDSLLSIAVAFECDCQERVLIKREWLLGRKPPTYDLESEIKLLIANWLAKRYRRASFADSFNERTRGATNKIRRKAKKVAELITGIYLLVVDDELPPETDYDIIVIATMRNQDYENIDNQEAAVAFLGEIESRFSESDGINVVHAELRSEAELSLAEFLKLRRWDFDDLTVRHEGPEKLP